MKTMSRFFFVVMAVLLSLTVLTEPCMAKKRGGRNRGRGRGRARGRGGRGRGNRMAQALRHHAKHNGVHTKLGEAKKGLKRIGVSSADLRKMHDAALSRQQERLKAPASSFAATVVARRMLQDAQSATNAPQSQGVSFQR
jgi:hypothetical protein